MKPPTKLSAFIFLLLVFSLAPGLPVHGADSTVTYTTSAIPTDQHTTHVIPPGAEFNISSNADFHNLAMTFNWPGNGTLQFPYIIEGKNFTGDNIGPVIQISNTDLYFIFRDNVIGRSTGALTGVLDFYNVTNAHIFNNIISTGDRGIWVNEFYDSYIMNNTLHNFDRAINLIRTDRVEIAHNNIHDNNQGILIESGGDGLLIRDNHIHQNTQGITNWAGASFNRIIHNDIMFNTIGIDLVDGFLIDVFGNVITNNTQTGLRMSPGSGAQVIYNNFWGNGIHHIEDQNANTVDRNFFANATLVDGDVNGYVDAPYAFAGGFDYNALMEPYMPPSVSLNPFGAAEFFPVDFFVSYNEANYPTFDQEYTIEYSYDGIIWQDFAGGANITVIYDPTIANGTSIFFRVVTIYDTGRVDDIVGPVILKHALPSSPPQLIEAYYYDGLVQLLWQEPATPGSGAITEYAIYRGHWSGDLELYAIVPSFQLSYNDTDIIPGLTYFYAVKAVDYPEITESDFSELISITIPDDIPPTFSVDGFSANSITEVSGEVGYIIIWEDNGGIQNLTVSVYQGFELFEQTVISDVDRQGAYTGMIDFNELPEGELTVEVFMSDFAGNVVFKEYIVENVHTIDPDPTEDPPSNNTRSDNSSESPEVSLDPLPANWLFLPIVLVTAVLIRKKYS